MKKKEYIYSVKPDPPGNFSQPSSSLSSNKPSQNSKDNEKPKSSNQTYKKKPKYEYTPYNNEPASEKFINKNNNPSKIEYQKKTSFDTLPYKKYESLNDKNASKTEFQKKNSYDQPSESSYNKKYEYVQKPSTEETSEKSQNYNSSKNVSQNKNFYNKNSNIPSKSSNQQQNFEKPQTNDFFKNQYKNENQRNYERNSQSNINYQKPEYQKRNSDGINSEPSSVRNQYKNENNRNNNNSNLKEEDKTYYLTINHLDELMLKSNDFSQFHKYFMTLMPLKRRLDKSKFLKKLIVPFFEILSVLVKNDSQESINIIKEVFESSNLKTSIKEELEYQQNQGLTDDNKFKSNVIPFLLNLYQVFVYATQYSRNIINNLPINDVIDAIEMFLVLKPNEKNLTALKQNFKNLEEVVKNIKKKNLIEKLEEKKNTEVFEKIYEVEIDYKEQNVYPTEYDCLNPMKKPTYFPHILKGPYPSAELYLNNMFYLLKEDYMKGIREAFQILQGNKFENNKILDKIDNRLFDSAYIYNDVSIQDVIFGDSGIYLTIILSPLSKNKNKSINWMNTKRMNFGSLLIICDEKLEKMFFSTVFEKPKGDKLNKDFEKYGNVEISIKGLGVIEHEELVRTINDLKKKKLLAIEARTYFESYYHFLKRLQEINPDDLPFNQLIVKSKIEVVGVPVYLVSRNMNNRLSEYIFDVDFKKISKNTNVVSGPKLNILQEKWPKNLQQTLDNSQYKALQNILTKNFSIIQGPPGTGKTFVGALAVKILLDNKDKWSPEYNNFRKGKGNQYDKRFKKPLLVVAFTNHALDQFLNHLLKFTNNIARIGGRCNDENIKKFTLVELRKLEKVYIRNFRELKETIEQLEEIKNFLFQVKPLNYHYFMKNLPFSQKNKRTNDLASPLENFGVRFANPLGKKSMEILFNYWRDGYYLDNNGVNNIKNIELKREKNQLIPLEDEEYDENYDENYEENYDENYDQDNGDAEEEKKESIIIGNNQNSKKNINNNQNIPLNQANVVNVEDDYDLSSELEDPDLELDRRLENDLEENMKLFENIRGGNKKINLFFTNEDYIRLISSDFFIEKNLWELSMQERNSLINYCFLQNHEQYEADFQALLKDYQKYMKLVEESRISRDLNILMSKKIVGVTVSGCAKYAHYLEKLEAPITIIEEAAEVLETHTISVLTKHTQHLIMIGDHQQLKPHIESYELEKKFNFNISLFERMINNGVNYVTLTNQRRMRPEFADFIRIIYAKDAYEDHESVQKYENIKGVKTNLFFFNHNKFESENQGLKSKVNKFEVDMIGNFSLYLTQNGYTEDRITILSMYVGQTLAIKTFLKKIHLNGIKVATVDNYQGEENDIILVSFVRSNKDNKLGFVKNENRMCVALSRAKMGMYLFGNFDCLFKGNHKGNDTEKGYELWRKIILLAQEKNVIGKKLNLSCQNHKQDLFIQEPNDFKNAPEGGCKKICNIKLECGHICKIPCHNFEHDRNDCVERCNSLFQCGHRCTRTCRNCIKGCGNCMEKIEKKLPCGHLTKMSCYLSPDKVLCQAPCPFLLSCGHKCQKKCSDQCNNGSCNVSMPKVLLCGHTQNVKCSESILSVKCEVKCKTTLSCGHECSGTCHKCFQGTLHYPCQEKCKRTYLCNHLCQKKCNEPCGVCEKKCEYTCCEAKCDLKCGDPCYECKNSCKLECPHSKCTNLCSEPCDRFPCDFPCNKTLLCGHLCLGLCGEKCVKACKECNPENQVFQVFFGTEDEPNARFYELQCGHAFEVSSLDKYMGLYEEEKQEVQNKAVKFKDCPSCKQWITRSKRYQAIIKETYKHITNAKRKLVEQNYITTQQIEGLMAAILDLKNNDIKKVSLWEKIEKELESYIKPMKNKKKPQRIIRQTYYNFYYLIKFYPQYKKILEFIESMDANQLEKHMQIYKLHVKNLGEYYLSNESVDVNDEQWEKIQKKLSILTIFKDLSVLKSTNSTLSAIINPCLNDIIKNNFDLADDKIETTKNFLKKYAITKEEQITIIKAMNLSSGHMFTCPNGHYYFIGECGGAMEISKCPECKSQIGGTNHQLLQGNRHTGEFDGSNYAAFSAEANARIGFGNFI